MATVSEATTGAISATVRVARAAYDLVVSVMLAPLKLSQLKAGEVQLVPRVMLVKAQAFVERLMQRRRPHMEAGWRLCEST